MKDTDMARKYVWLKADGYGNSIGLTKLMAVAAVKVVSGRGPFALTQDGELLHGNMARIDVLGEFKQAISHREIGSVFRIRRGDGDVVFTARAVQAISEIDSTNGNDRSDAFFNWVKSEYKSYDPRFAGSYVCKTVSGSSTMSQHSYGNADDFFFNSFTHQDEVAHSVVAHADLLHPYHVISGSRIWTKGSGWNSYGGDFHSHLHVDFDPQYSGSCGVRE